VERRRRKPGEFVIGATFGCTAGFGANENYRKNLGEPKDRAEAIRVLRKAWSWNYLSTQRIRTGLQSARKSIAESLLPLSEGTGDRDESGAGAGRDRTVVPNGKSRRTCARLRGKPAAIAVSGSIFSNAAELTTKCRWKISWTLKEFAEGRKIKHIGCRK